MWCHVPEQLKLMQQPDSFCGRGMSPQAVERGLEASSDTPTPESC